MPLPAASHVLSLASCPGVPGDPITEYLTRQLPLGPCGGMDSDQEPTLSTLGSSVERLVAMSAFSW